MTLAWCFEDQTTPSSQAVLERLVEEQALVPELWSLEVANVLALAERRGRIRAQQSARFIGFLDRLPITVEELGRELLFGRVLDLANSTGLTVYDASYLALAQRAGVPLATTDGPLWRAAAAAGTQLLSTS